MTAEFVDVYIDFAEKMFLTLIPPGLFFTVVAWRKARKWWPYKVPVVSAIVNTIAITCSLALGVVIVWRYIGPLPDWTPILTATVIVVLPGITFLNTALLVVLDNRPRRRATDPRPKDTPHRRGDDDRDVSGHWML